MGENVCTDATNEWLGVESARVSGCKEYAIQSFWRVFGNLERTRVFGCTDAIRSSRKFEWGTIRRDSVGGKLFRIENRDGEADVSVGLSVLLELIILLLYHNQVFYKWNGIRFMILL